MAAPTLAQLAQLDYSAGMFRSVARHLIPDDGAWDIVNGLLDEDGSVYRRGGCTYLATSAFGSAETFLWDGFLKPGQRTVQANSADFGVLDAAEAPVNLGGAGLSRPKRAVAVADILHIGGGTLYGGSRKTADYTTGTVTVTNGSKTVTGAGTTWNTLVDAGMLFQVGSGRYYVVASIDSTTQITLRDAYVGTTAAGAAYGLRVLGTAPKASDIYATVADRLLVCSGAKIEFSEPGDPQTFGANDFHELPGGIEIIGAVGLRDVAVIFTTAGIWTISGLNFDIVDANGNSQHQVVQVNGDLVLLDHQGITAWSNALVIPCSDGVWLFDAVNPPVKLTASIGDLWTEYVRAGYRIGIPAVFGSTLLLPILASTGATNIDTLVCRLDRPVSSRVGIVYPWTRLDGYAGDVAAFAVRHGGQSAARDPDLLAASLANGRVTKCTSFFEPAQAVASDADSSTHTFTLVTRDHPTGSGLNDNLVRYARVRYELAGASSPTLAASYSIGETDLTGFSLWDVALWGTGLWAEEDAGEWEGLSGVAPIDNGRLPKSWRVNKKSEYIRLKLYSSGAASKLVIRSTELFVRQSGKA